MLCLRGRIVNALFTDRIVIALFTDRIVVIALFTDRILIAVSRKHQGIRCDVVTEDSNC